MDDIGKGAQSRETVIRAEGVRRDEFLLGEGATLESIVRFSSPSAHF